MDISLIIPEPPTDHEQAYDWLENLKHFWLDMVFDPDLQGDFHFSERIDYIHYIYAGFCHSSVLFEYFMTHGDQIRVNTLLSLLAGFGDLFDQQYGFIAERILSGDVARNQASEVVLWHRSARNKLKLAKTACQLRTAA